MDDKPLRQISIHALREEGDSNSTIRLSRFLTISIHALREEGDAADISYDNSKSDFYPRPPRGGRPANSWDTLRLVTISIHALREEGDAGFVDLSGYVEKISIHALREEGDVEMSAAGISLE